MKFKKISILFVIALAIFAVGCSQPAETDTEAEETEESIEVPEDAVAKVDDSFIYEDEFNKNVAIIKYMYESEYGDDIWDQEVQGMKVSNIAKEQTLDRLIQVRLIKDYVEKNSDIEIDEEELEGVLEDLNTELAKDEARKTYYDENNITDEFIYEQIKDGEYMQKFYSMIEEEIEADDAFLQERYQNYVAKVDASHILVEDEATAKVVSEKLAAGEDFAEMAKEYSTDPGSGANGGDLGFFDRGKMVPAFEEVAFSSAVDSISDPVQSQFGFHIIRVNDKKTVQDMIDDEEKEETINRYKSQIVQGAIEQRYQKKLNELMNNNEIEKYINNMEVPSETTDDASTDESTTETDDE
ncbi:MAG TPA: peptidylprolyl isomerase [Clostridia bacterium]|nr:peptidylprolyl isomerase [Clostridia bacterium]